MIKNAVFIVSEVKKAENIPDINFNKFKCISNDRKASVIDNVIIILKSKSLQNGALFQLCIAVIAICHCL